MIMRPKTPTSPLRRMTAALSIRMRTGLRCIYVKVGKCAPQAGVARPRVALIAHRVGEIIAYATMQKPSFSPRDRKHFAGLPWIPIHRGAR